MAENKEALKANQTLAHLLEFLARLENKTEVKEKVIEEILKKVKDYITGDLGKFATGGGSTGYLPQTIDKSKELRSNILKMDGTYKHYETAFNDSDANKYVKHLIDNIFPLFGCLYYMYYECNDNCVVIYGNEWHDERCDGKGTKGENLNQWLLNATGTERIIARGFKQGDLSDKEGDKLFPKSESEATPLLDYLQGAQLQFCLYYMLFLPGKWNDAQSGHALLFLQAFCQKVYDGKFQDKYNDNGDSFRKACLDVTEKISTLTGLKIIAPVAADNTTVKYDSLLEPEHFSKYVKWLKQNLQGLIKSLTEMKNDACNWDAYKLITSETFGPYPWGFTFKDHNWESKTKDIKSKLEQQLSQLIEALESFKEKVQSLSATQSKGHSEKAAETPSASIASNNSTTSPTSTVSTKQPSNSTTSPTSNNSTDSTNSTASTIGGVAGGIGAAAATGAAAYAGSGFLGPVAEAFGKFFKGLLL